MLKLAVNQGVLFTTPTNAFLELCANSGLKAVELRVPKLKEWLYEVPASSVRKKIGELGISVVALNSIDDFGLVPAENLALLKAEVEFVGHLCEMVECPLVIAPVGRWFDHPLPEQEVMDLTLERLELLDKVLRPRGVSIGVEPIAFPEFSIGTIHQADKLVIASALSDCGLVVDYYNLFQGGMIPADFFELKSPVHMIHINNAELLPLKDLDVVRTRTYPGDGSFDAVAWTTAALEAGYSGYFSLELFSRMLWDMKPEAAMYQVAGKLKDFVRQVEQNNEKESL